MSTANQPEGRRARAWAMQGLIGCAGAAVAACAAQTWLADSPYAFAVTHRPLVTALVALASAVDWYEGVKVVVILGASWPLMLDAGRWLLGRPGTPPPMPNAARTARRAPAFGLEAAR
jgi:hypothetical protein